MIFKSKFLIKLISKLTLFYYVGLGQLYAKELEFFSTEGRCNYKINFLPQTHKKNALISGVVSSQITKVFAAVSQLNIALYIQEHSELPVFDEEFYLPISQQVTSDYRKRAAVIAGQVFPDGLPNHSVNLNDNDQIDFLHDIRGPIIQFFRGVIDEVYPVIDPESYNKIMPPINEWLKNSTREDRESGYPLDIAKLIYEKREKAALVSITDFFKNNPETKEVILVYGSNHNFGFYEDLFPKECVSVPTSFYFQWRGKDRASSVGF